MRKIVAASPHGLNCFGQEISQSCESRRVVVFPKWAATSALPNASEKIPSTPACNYAAYKPTRRDPPPDARGISESICHGFQLLAARILFPFQPQITLAVENQK